MITSKLVSPRTTFKAYPHLDTDASPLSPRSRLFRLEPIGIGTPDVECLTSYVARLAAEHCVSPRKLLCKEVLAPAGKATVHYSTSSIFSASLINGMGQLAALTVNTLERLTLRDDLRYMTMLSWGNVLSTHLLLRTNKAWCHICYGEWLNEGEPIYDPLVWAFKSISLCSRHHEPLRQLCPYCKRKLPLLTTFSYPGFCSKCQMWLGATVNGGQQDDEKLGTSTERIKQITEAYSIGELLSCTVKLLPLPELKDFVANLTGYLNQVANGNINVFSDLVGIWSGTIRRLVSAETKLSLKMLCQLCSRLNISPYDLLSNKGNKVISKSHLWVRNSVPSQKIHQIRKKPPQVKEVVPWNQAESEIQAICREDPPPSLEAVARRFERHSGTIKNHFPKQSKLITIRYREYINKRHPPPEKVRKALRLALKEQPPPSLQCVLRRLGCRDTGSYYYSHYTELCLAVSQRFKNHRNNPFSQEADGKQLHNTLTEYPPPSFSEVVRRLGHTREFVRRKFPELSKAIVTRYTHYQAALRSEMSVRLRHTIRVAAQQIIASGEYVSEARVRNRVKEHLKKIGRDSLFKQALREVKREMGLTK